MNIQLISALVDSLEREEDSPEHKDGLVPEGYALESITYSVTITVQADLARANLAEAL